MARSLRIQFPGAFYHITCRGNERKSIFLNDDDRRNFLALLVESLETYHVILYAYVLMTNHFHLVLQTMRANLSEFMRRFNICYTGKFHYRHGTCGHLYQGRYKAFVIDASNYLLEVSRYVHLNPVRKDKSQSSDYRDRWHKVRRYQWSSLPGYLNEKRAAHWVDYDTVFEMVGGRRAYRTFVVDGLIRNIENPFAYTQHQMILGGDDFVARVKSKHLAGGSLRDQPAYRELVTQLIEPDIIMTNVAAACRIKKALLCQRRGAGVERGIAAEMLHKYSGLTLKQIGVVLGNIDYGAVHQLCRRLRRRMTNDRDVVVKYQQTESMIQDGCSK